ncbi:Hypothetical_protein [Hexamita inflata]|uniref:Hypothetical_protein n=1 Tax=Hexamita inflata TaxID=28002 RepID=A0AA86RBM4_9EUKA|nr:Hypothetical protein HINF_LOCUS9368 [Hexamita inflata]CAI9951371.1 Hypothetical protein HINF_LOCUS39016 [Hexamita inflata]CAI9975031.1 Hypothetical protein HINF_LOCUS62676 [Hexamita inflata]
MRILIVEPKENLALALKKQLEGYTLYQTDATPKLKELIETKLEDELNMIVTATKLADFPAEFFQLAIFETGKEPQAIKKWDIVKVDVKIADVKESTGKIMEVVQQLMELEMMDMEDEEEFEEFDGEDYEGNDEEEDDE